MNYETNGMIDFEAIELEARRLRAQAAAEMLAGVKHWFANRRIARRIAGAHAA